LGKCPVTWRADAQLRVALDGGVRDHLGTGPGSLLFRAVQARELVLDQIPCGGSRDGGPKEPAGRKNDRPFAHPTYWAPLILIRDPGRVGGT
jgi:hypothetical protein